MLFWIVAALVVLGSLSIVFAPMIRGAGAAERRASYDLQIYRDQLREIDRDVARGVISPQEAEDTRVEISRKLLAAADEESREGAASGAPRAASRAMVAVWTLLAVGLTGWIYVGQGAPGFEDQPLAERLARQAEARANRPRQAEVEAIIAEDQAAADQAGAEGPLRPEIAAGEEAADPEHLALVDQLMEVLAERPNDLQGHRLLVSSLGALGRFAEARVAQERVVEILGDEVGPDDLVGLAELMVTAAAGYVSPEAEAALSRALAVDPRHPVGRYYSGLTVLQGGRPDLAYRLWAGLLEEGPPEAPWVQAIEMDIEAVALMAGMPVPGTGVPSGEPAPEGPAPGIAMPPPGAPLPEFDDDTRGMVEGMVASLGSRLATEGGAPSEWAQLIRSLGVLGRIGEAAAIWAEAQDVFADDAASLAEVREAAREARLLQ
jgi:cytochrome c-type biogenesis protein CcmH